MRLDGASQEDHDFTGWLLNVGHGTPRLTGDDQTICHPETIECALGN